jgi:hypothetical protein
VNTAVFAALMACLAFTAAGPYLARALPPRAAVWMVVPAALLAAGCGVFVLGTVAFTWLGQLGEVAELGTWSPQTLHALSPIPPAVAVIAGGLLVPAAAWTLTRSWRTARALWDTHRACRHLDPAGAPIVVVHSDDLDAFTLPGIRGRVVVTTGLLAALDASGRRVLLAHELSTVLTGTPGGLSPPISPQRSTRFCVRPRGRSGTPPNGGPTKTPLPSPIGGWSPPPLPGSPCCVPTRRPRPCWPRRRAGRFRSGWLRSFVPRPGCGHAMSALPPS